jgi:transcription elongation factor Elf1
MSMWIDQKYIGTISARLEKFSRKGNYLYNFRCPICGDSQTNRNKTRGYVYAGKGGLFFKCHNCSASMTVGNLIKHVDPALYKEYCLDRYKEGETGRKPHKDHGFVFKPVTFGSKTNENFKGVLTKLTELPETHEAFRYVISRKIPKNKYKKLYFVDDVQKLKKFSPNYEEKIVTNEPRLVVPFFDDTDNLVGMSCRALRGEKQRYLVVKIIDNSPMLFNMNDIDTSENVYVTEGAIDSLFLPNAVAVGNSNLKYALNYLPKDKLVLVYDNEPRNKEIVREMKDAIDEGAQICIWPKSFEEKDINEMILAGKAQDEILDTINKNTFCGAQALLEFNIWRMR